MCSYSLKVFSVSKARPAFPTSPTVRGGGGAQASSLSCRISTGTDITLQLGWPWVLNN